MSDAEITTTDSSSFRLSMSLLSYLGVDSSSELPWGHAVNSRAQLEACLNDKKPQMLEADILLSEQCEAIMCHPPLRESDITFREWLEAVISHLLEVTNRREGTTVLNEAGRKSKLGVKLDFKDSEALLPCLTELRHCLDNYQCLQELAEKGGVWINYDVLQGPCGGAPRFDPHRCIPLTQQHFPLAYFSLGWTTGAQTNGSCIPYSSDSIDEMLELCGKYNVATATFPVRASLVKCSWDDALSRLIFNHDDNNSIRTEDFSITIWHSKVDAFELDLKEWLYQRLLERLKDVKASHSILSTRFFFDLSG